MLGVVLKCVTMSCVVLPCVKLCHGPFQCVTVLCVVWYSAGLPCVAVQSPSRAAAVGMRARQDGQRMVEVEDAELKVLQVGAGVIVGRAG